LSEDNLSIAPTDFWASVTEVSAIPSTRWRFKMNIVPNQSAFFDDEATRVMGLAFDQACGSLRYLACTRNVRELIAKQIIDAARNGERDPTRLHSRALTDFSIDNMSMPMLA
jgi:hypothetical protein